MSKNRKKQRVNKKNSRIERVDAPQRRYLGYESKITPAPDGQLAKKRDITGTEDLTAYNAIGSAARPGWTIVLK